MLLMDVVEAEDGLAMTNFPAFIVERTHAHLARSRPATRLENLHVSTNAETWRAATQSNTTERSRSTILLFLERRPRERVGVTVDGIPTNLPAQAKLTIEDYVRVRIE